MNATAVSARLTRLEPTLPSHYYFDREHYERELALFWYRDWHIVGRVDGLSDPGDYRLIKLGEQNIIVTRDEQSQLKAFHNTCRHRGSELCAETQGKFPGGRIVCPYHSWTYSLGGELTHTPWRLPSADFDHSHYSLYEVAVEEWAGFLFINLESAPDRGLNEAIASWPDLFSNWHFDTARTGHQRSWTIACNWKVFWENFSECYHCPGIHPELSRISGEYAKGIIRASDEPDWEPEEQESPYRARLRPEVETWSDDGSTNLPYFSGLNEDERQMGHNFSVLLPSGFVAAHRDYVRFGYLVPEGPEQIRFTIEWLFPPETLEDPEVDLSSPIDFITRLTEQDVRVCALNQRGLHGRRHENGVLVPQEYLLREFHEWVLGRLAEEV